jgi:Fe-S cluster assembly ATP-binding protein
MGPNGAGKSTLAYTLGGRPGYDVTGGSVDFDGADLLAMDPHERAAAGLFLGFQYPVEIPGVSNVQFLREALNAQRKQRGEEAAVGLPSSSWRARRRTFCAWTWTCSSAR